MKSMIGKLNTFVLLVLMATGMYTVVAAKGKQLQSCFNVFEDSARTVPVEILDFGGEVLTAKKISLWCKARSNSAYTITVEHSRNGKDFVPIGTFFNQEEISKYSLIDYRPVHNTNYYRLKITDAKGRTNYSRLMVVQLYRTATLSMVSVTPNPVQNDIRVDVQLKDRAFVSMKITDAEGREILKKRVQGGEGMNQFQLDGSAKMTPGNYLLLVVVNNTETLTIPLIKG